MSIFFRSNQMCHVRSLSKYFWNKRMYLVSDHMFSRICELFRYNFHVLIQIIGLLLQHGLTYFLQNPYSCFAPPITWFFDSCKEIAISKAISSQLLALGYGREERHPGCDHVLDKTSTAFESLTISLFRKTGRALNYDDSSRVSMRALWRFFNSHV